MAYFDSSKNRALWEIRLKELKEERAARAAGEGKRDITREVKPMSSPTRIRMTYAELLREEAEFVKQSRRHAPGMEKSQEREALREHQREAGAYEKS